MTFDCFGYMFVEWLGIKSRNKKIRLLAVTTSKLYLVVSGRENEKKFKETFLEVEPIRDNMNLMNLIVSSE